MSYTSIFSERALKEIIEARNWYEDKVHGLGDKFKDAIFSKIKEIEKDPTTELQRHYPYRESIVNKFPYLIIFRIKEDSKQLFIHSIFHTRRNPNKKYKNT